MNFDGVISLFQVNKDAAFRILFEKYYKKVYKAVYYLTKDYDISQDCAQEAFIVAYKKLHQLKEPEKFEAWICKIAINIAKKQVNNRVLLTDSAGAIETKDESNKIMEDSLIVKEMLAKLPPEYRETVYFRYYLDLRVEDIAEILDTPLGTIKSRLSRFGEIIRKNY